ncbi:glycoprotein-N-acetylgalactosamine 3-beta-galactosyltransferase 1 isoform X2 [Channa argus]|uniref:glycoprotein-N-acetylgalactosamine 3-beta-galactosyltransferase 1 isoform X2 n=1 Tax=Channa argus TaxID=215402 RepID=UPI0035219400
MRRICSNFIFITGVMVGFLSLHFLLMSTSTKDQMIYLVRNVNHEAKHGLQQSDQTSSAANSSHTTRILCWIMTGPSNLESRTKHIRATWAKRCDKVLYMSSIKTDFPTVGLNVTEGRENLYWKTIRAFQFIHQHHLNEADWFLKADDDTFVVIENLRYTLYKYDPEKPFYLGRRFTPFIRQGYMSGGGGYVLSKEALRRFVKGFDTGECNHFSSIEDMALGKCMETMKVEPTDTRDIKGRQTFHAYPPDYYVVRQLPRPRPWYRIYDHYTPVEDNKAQFSSGSLGCCSGEVE